ncbi:MAG TPA: hypothetical protein DER01_18345 [Phycisphaerales bacterium]|nr:hypothetical protein [Phycisphaerales bacterium]
MTRNILTHSAIAASLCLTLTGCEMLSYSGGWKISKREQKSVEAYHKFLEERDLAMQSGTSAPASAPMQTTIPPAHQLAAAQQSDMVDTTSAPSNAWASGQISEPVIQPTANPWEPAALSNPSALPPADPMPMPRHNQRPNVNFGSQNAMQPEYSSNFRKPISRASASPEYIFGTVPNSPPDISGSGDTDPQNITRVSYANEGGDFDVDLSPDGKQIAFASTRHAKTADIYVKSTTGMAIMQITNDPAHDVTPTFSPDGSKIAFASDRSGNWDIYIVDIQGGQPVQITNQPTQDLSPSFSPDGKWLVFASYGTQSGAWEMVVVNVKNPSIKRFIGFGLFPKWSPVGNKILFQRARQRGTQWFSIWTVELMNGEAMRPTEIIASANAAAITPSWSPDGKHVVFATVVNGVKKTGDKRPPQSDIWMASLEGTGRTNLTRSRFSNLQPKWATDGSIYFVSNRGQNGIENIWSIKPERSLQIVNTMDQMAGNNPTPAGMVGMPTQTLQQAGVTP